MYPPTIRLAAPSLLLPTTPHLRCLSPQLRANASLSRRPQLLQRHVIRRLRRASPQHGADCERPGHRPQALRRGHDESVQHELRLDGRHRPRVAAARRTQPSGTFPSLVESRLQALFSSLFLPFLWILGKCDSPTRTTRKLMSSVVSARRCLRFLTAIHHTGLPQVMNMTTVRLRRRRLRPRPRSLRFP